MHILLRPHSLLVQQRHIIIHHPYPALPNRLLLIDISAARPWQQLPQLPCRGARPARPYRLIGGAKATTACDRRSPLAARSLDSFPLQTATAAVAGWRTHDVAGRHGRCCGLAAPAPCLARPCPRAPADLLDAVVPLRCARRRWGCNRQDGRTDGGGESEPLCARGRRAGMGLCGWVLVIGWRGELRVGPSLLLDGVVRRGARLLGLYKARGASARWFVSGRCFCPVALSLSLLSSASNHEGFGFSRCVACGLCRCCPDTRRWWRRWW